MPKPKRLVWILLPFLIVAPVSPAQGLVYEYAIAPSSLFFELSPGDAGGGVITITSLATAEIAVDATVTGIIRDWIDANQTGRIVLGPGESRAISVHVTVPDEAEPGNHTAALIVRQVVEGEGHAVVAVATSVVITVSVLGLIIEAGEITSFPNLAVSEGSEEALFRIHFKNTGTVTTRATASVRVLGDDGLVVAEGSARVENPVRPDRVAVFVVPCSVNHLPAGNYTTIATVSFDGKAVEKEGWLYVEPKPVPPPAPPVPTILVLEL